MSDTCPACFAALRHWMAEKCEACGWSEEVDGRPTPPKAAAPAPAPRTIAQRCDRVIEEIRGVRSLSGVSDWEFQRLEEWRQRSSLSAKQLRILEQIETKVFGETDE